MDADDLGRMFGWEFSLIIATIRVINSGLLDELPDLKIHFSHFSGGIGRYRGRYNGFQQRTKWGTSQIKGHNRQPKLPVDHYLNNRLLLRLRRLGRARPVRAARRRLGEVRPAGAGAVAMRVRHRLSAGDPRSGRGAWTTSRRSKLLDPNANALVHGLNAEKLIPNIKDAGRRSGRNRRGVMAADRSKHPIVHFVGSIPLPDTETVFRTLSQAVGPHLIRLPDGETGIRKTWIRFLQDVLANNPAIECATDVPPFKFVQWDGKLVREIPRLRIKPGATPDPATFKTGYADMAIESWGVFERLQKAGVIPAGVKFQICLPTPIAPIYNNMVPADRPKLLPALMPHFIGEVGEDRQGAAERSHRDAMGRLPGGAGLGGLLRPGPGRFPHRDHRRADAGSATACRPASSSAITSATAARPTSTWCSPRTWASWSR